MEIDRVEALEIEKLERVSSFLSMRSLDMGVTGLSVRSEVLSVDHSFDYEGPITWAIFMHSAVLARLAGVEGMPFECVTDGNALFGNRGAIKEGGLPVSFAAHFLDAALEHAVVASMQALGCTSDEWVNLPEDLRVIAVEPYIMDVANNWVSETLRVGTLADKIVNWPTLLDFKTHDQMMGQQHSLAQGEVPKASPLSSLSPRQ